MGNCDSSDRSAGKSESINYLPENSLESRNYYFNHSLRIRGACAVHNILLAALVNDDATAVIEYYRMARHSKTRDSRRAFSLESLILTCVYDLGLINVLYLLRRELPWIVIDGAGVLNTLVHMHVDIVFYGPAPTITRCANQKIRDILATHFCLSRMFNYDLSLENELAALVTKIQRADPDGINILVSEIRTDSRTHPEITRMSWPAPAEIIQKITGIVEVCASLKENPWFPVSLFRDLSRRDNTVDARLALISRLEPQLMFTDNLDATNDRQPITRYEDHSRIMLQMFLKCGARDIREYFQTRGDVGWANDHFSPYYAFRNVEKLPRIYSTDTAWRLFFKDNNALRYFAVFNHRARFSLPPELVKAVIDCVH